MRGFTLIEVMVVIGVVAILALMAMPNYSERIIRDQIVEAMPLADIAKPAVQLGWATTQALPVNNSAAGLPSPDRIVNNYISAVHLEGGSLHIVFGNSVNNVIKGKILTLRPAVVEDAPIVPVTWVCGYAPAPGKMVFKSVNKTDIPPNLLPLRCRAAPAKT